VILRHVRAQAVFLLRADAYHAPCAHFSCAWYLVKKIFFTFFFFDSFLAGVTVHPESRPSRWHEIRTFPSWNCFGISCRGAIISCRQNSISWRVLWIKTLCHEIAPFIMKLQVSVMNQLSASWVTFLGSDSGPLFFNFFLTFMSDGHDGVVQCHTFRHEITATPRHEIGSFGAKFIVSGTQFRYSRNENCTSRHQFGTKMALSGAILQPGSRTRALHELNYGGLSSDVSLFLLKNQSKKCSPLVARKLGRYTHVYSGQWVCLHVRSGPAVRAVAAQSCLVRRLFLGTDHGESPGLIFARHTCTRMALSRIHCVEW